MSLTVSQRLTITAWSRARTEHTSPQQLSEDRKARLEYAPPPAAIPPPPAGSGPSGRPGPADGGGLSLFDESVLACIERHGGCSFTALPPQSELCFELRTLEPIKRGYAEQGVQL